MNYIKYKIFFLILSIVILQIGYSDLLFSQCVLSVSPTSVNIPGLGGSEYIYLTTDECESYDAYTNDSWIYVWVDYYEQIVTVYADPNHEGSRGGTVIIDDYESEDDFYITVDQEYGCEQLPSPGEITGPSEVCAGGTATFSISPIEGATSYSWKVDGISAGSYGTTALLLFPTYGSFSIVTAAGYNECGEGIQSSRQITLHYAPSPGSIGEYQSIPYNTAPSALFSISPASNGLGSLNYQWQYSFIVTSNWDNIEGATGLTYSPGVLTSDIYFRRAVSDNCRTAYSNSVHISQDIPHNNSSLYNYEPNPETRTLNPGYLVGTTNGSFIVDPEGAASYTIPLELPSGINGLTPDLSLVYLSNGGSDIAGYGWQISGLSTINRGPRTMYHDGFVWEVEMNTNDRFYLDGQRLVNTSSTYGNPNAQYQTENDIFTRVTPQATNTYGPTWFKTETKSGLFYEYGNTAESKLRINGYFQVLKWCVSKVSDQFGNSVNYKYIQHRYKIYPAEITYGPYTITFFYKDREDIDVKYFKGARIEQWLLLDKITVKYNSTVIKTYELEHSYSGWYRKQSILTEVVEYGTGTSRLNSTAISYQINASVSFSQTTYNTTDNYITYKSKLYSGDFNGDGKTDFLCLPDASKGATWTGMRVYFSDGNDNFTSYFTNTNSLNLTSLKDIRALDLNGDGLDDLIYEMCPSTESTFYYMLCTGSSFTGPININSQSYNLNTGFSGKTRRNGNRQEDDNERAFSSRRGEPAMRESSESFSNQIAADYNGDGVNDIFLNDPSGNWRIMSFVNSSGQMTSTLNLLYSGTISTLNGEVISGDFNGDGKSDIWSIENSGFKIYTLTGSYLTSLISSDIISNSIFFRLGDFNADGKMDIFSYGDVNSDWDYWKINLSKGTSFEVHSIDKMKNNLRADLVRSGDFSGDGTTDIMVTSSDESWTGTYFYVPMGMGTYLYQHTLGSYPVSTHNYYLGDYNGDGHTDFICTDGEESWWNGYQVYKTTGNTSIIMDKVANGLGNLTKITYSKLSQTSNNVYQKGTGAVFPVSDFQGPWTVVSSVQVDNGKGTMNTRNYYYEGAKIHLRGKGFLCFAKTKITEVVSGIENISISGYNTTYYYPLTLKALSKLAGASTDTLGKTVNSWSHIILDGTTKRIFPYLAGSTQTNYKTGHSVTINAQYDNWGNPASITKSYSNGPIEITTNTYNNTATSSQWLLGRPLSTTVQYTYNTATITRSGTRVFDQNNNHLTSETWFSGTDKQITKSYSYNSNGTLQSETATASGMSRSKSITYVSDNIRIHTTTDQLSHVTTNIYDSNGRLTSTQDYLGNTDTYQYDDLGRLTSVSLNDGSQSTTAFAWEDTSAIPVLARYSVLKTGNDGSQTKILYDKLGREVRSDVKGFDGTLIYTATVYNVKGQIESMSDPYFSNDTPLWNTFIYDTCGRKINLNRPSGRNTTWQYNNNTVTEITAGKSLVKTFSSDGTVALATDAGGTINYTYYPDGKVKTITAPGGIITSVQYDLAGNQTQLVDPSADTTTYTYNGFSELVTQVSPGPKTTAISYYEDGRISEKGTPEGTTTYTYNSNKQLTNISSPGGVSRSLGYDTIGRVISVIETIPGSTPFSTSFTYDNLGRSATITHPSGITETYNFNSNGYLDVILAGDTARWTINSMNAKQQVTSGQYGSNLSATFGYDAYGFPTSTNAGTLQNYSYSFDPVTGNLNWRQNNKYSELKESFSYDNLDRLDNVYKGITTPVMTLDMAYDSNKGGITTKSDIGTFLYETTGKPYAVSSIDPFTGPVPSSNQVLTYTSFESVSTIIEGNYSASFLYNSDNERAKMVIQQGSGTILTRWYPSCSYIKETAGSVTKEYTFIGGDAYSAPVVAIIQSGTTTYYNLLRDYLGNIIHVVNSATSEVVAEYSFDAWGRMRNPSTWVNYAPGSEPVLFVAGRGFTGHEHLPWFSLINMNGRIYDPLIAMFLSPDNYIQNPDFTQDFNRYSYCLNNPLSYVDPSGEIGLLLSSLIYFAGYYIINWLSNVINGMTPKEAFQQTPIIIGLQGTIPYKEKTPPVNNNSSGGPGISLDKLDRELNNYEISGNDATAFWSLFNNYLNPLGNSRNFTASIDDGGTFDILKLKLYLPVAFTMDLFLELEGFGATYMVPGGVGIVLRGNNAGDIFGYFGGGVGGGLIGASGGLNSTYYFYFGDVSKFNQYSLEGPAKVLTFGAGEGLGFGRSIILMTDRYKNKIVGLSTSAGVTGSFPFPFSAQILPGQYIKIWGRRQR